MISVTITSRELTAKGACAEGKAQFLRAFPRGIRVKDWTPLHAVWSSLWPTCGWALKEGVIPRADLRGANLEGAYLEGADLRWANLRGAYLARANLRGAYLEGADLRGAYLEGADLRWANLRGAYLEGATMPEGFVP